MSNSSSDSKPDSDTVDASDSISAGEIFFKKDITILFQEPLPHLDKGLTRAYRAIGKNKIAADLFVLICNRAMTPRRMSTIKYQKISNGSLVKLIDSGAVIWPDDDQEKMCFVYEHSVGKPMWMERENAPMFGWKSDHVLKNVVTPIIDVLNDLRNKDLVHGEIWPGNMFFQAGIESAEQNNLEKDKKIKLGECLSTPPSSQLPALYEPIERAMADPMGRGAGIFSDDLYAFGVTLAVILRTNDTLKGLSDEEIIEKKVEQGSYVTLIGKERISASMMELLRGLLHDDPAQRWTLEDIQAWSDGRRLTPKQAAKRIKSIRPIIVGDKKYSRPELLAKDMWVNVDEVVKMFENDELQQWVARAIEDKALKSRVDQTVKEIKTYDKSAGYKDRMIVKLSTAFYTEIPVRFKNLNFHPNGFGKLLSAAYIEKKDIQDYVEVLKQNFVIPVIRGRNKMTDSGPMVTRFDSCRSIIKQTAMNKGLERCIYLLDGECPCLSPIVKDYYVQTPEDMMQAFEKICEKSKPATLFDRHIIAFLSLKDRRNLDPHLIELSASEPDVRFLGQLRTLATIQKRSGIGGLPALANWFADHMTPLYERLHDSKRRKVLQRRIERIKDAGDLTEMAVIYDGLKIFLNDINEFYATMSHYKKIEKERVSIHESLNSKRQYGLRTGRQVATVISVVMSILIIIVSAYIVTVRG